MPTITTTVTSAAASGVVTTQTTTEATPAATPEAASSRAVELTKAILGAWAADGGVTLARDVAKYYAPDAVADWGSTAINLPQFKKYVGHAGITEWLEEITATADVHQFDCTYSAGSGDACYVHVNWNFTVKATGKTFKGTDIIYYTFNSDGMATGMTMFWTNPLGVEAAYTSDGDPVAAAVAILDSWEAGTLAKDVPQLFAEDAVADWGSDAINLPQYAKYTGHASIVEWLGKIDEDLEFTKFDRTHSEAKGNGCYIHIDWTVTVKSTGKSVSSTDIIYYTFNSDGKATGITMYWTNPGALEAAYSA